MSEIQQDKELREQLSKIKLGELEDGSPAYLEPKEIDHIIELVEARDKEVERKAYAKAIATVKDCRYSCYKDEQCWEHLSEDRQQGIIEHEAEVIAKLDELSS